jgi:hypothetical protein
MSDKLQYSPDDANRDLPKLKGWSNRLMEIAQKFIISGNININNEPFQLMCMSFISRQIEHIGSLIALGNHRDMGIIARTMLEGMILLLWARQNKNERPKHWKDFVYIHDWRMLIKHKKQGIIVPPEKWDEAFSRAIATGDMFYSHKAKKCVSDGKILPVDPYWRSWIEPKKEGKSENKRTWWDLFHEVGLDELYSNLYAPLASLFHWEASSVVQSISKTNEGIQYKSSNDSDVFYSILIGIISLHVTLQIVEKEFAIGMNKELSEFQQQFQDWHKTIHTICILPVIE